MFLKHMLFTEVVYFGNSVKQAIYETKDDEKCYFISNSINSFFNLFFWMEIFHSDAMDLWMGHFYGMDF